MIKILFTGFEPFGGDDVNPSWEAVSLLPERLENICIAKRRMPVEYDAVGQLLAEAIKEEQPDAVICVGQAGGRTALTPEFVAINVKDATIPDNAGVLYGGEPVCPDGPAAYFATIPVKRIAAAMKDAGVPAAVSYTAGEYVCNCLMYHLLYLLEKEYPNVKGGFIHIPYICEQVLQRPSYASFPLELMVKGLEAAAKAVAEALENGSEDLRVGAGSTH